MDEILQFWLILKRRWLPASVVLVAVFGLSFWRAFQETPIYQSTGQLLFKKNTTSSLTGVGSQLGQLESSVSGNPLQNEAAILRSLPLAERVVATLNLPQSPNTILSQLSVKSITGTDIMELSYIDVDSKRSAAIINTLMNIYIENDKNANRAQTKAASEFIQQQLPLREAALRAAEVNLQRFKQQNRVLDLKSEAAATVGILNQLDGQVASNRAELAAQSARTDSVRQLFGVGSQEAVVEGIIGESPTTIPVLQQIQDIQQRIEVERLRFTDSHPRVLNLREQEAILKDELQRRIKQSFIGNVGRLNKKRSADEIVQLRPQGLQQGLLGSLAGAEAERVSLQSRLKALDQVIVSYRQRAQTLPQLELQQRQLERQIAATESSYKNLLDRYQELQVAENQEVGNARIITPAIVPSQPLKARQYMSLVQGLIGGILLGAAVAWILEKMDKTVKTTDSARNILGYPLLGSIPVFSSRNLIQIVPELIVKNNPDSSISEAFRMLQTNLRFLNSEQPLKVIVVTSSIPKEGKSTIAANLAVAISQLGRKVLLVDGDLRHPTQHKIWETSNELGLSNVVLGQSDLSKATTEVMPNLQVLSAGIVDVNPVAILDSSQMAVFVGKVAPNYDLVIIDTPPLTVAADATILGKISNGILLVVRPGVADSANLGFTKEILEQAGQNVLGLVVNGVSSKNPSSSYSMSNMAG